MTAYAYTAAVTTTTGFTTNCAGSFTTTGINNAAKAFDAFSIVALSAGNTNPVTGGTAITAITDPFLLPLAKSLGQQARASLAPSVKMEVFTKAFSDTQAVILQELTAQKAIINPLLAATGLTLDTPTKAALAGAYTSIGTAMTASLNSLQTKEIDAYKPVASIDVDSVAIATAMGALVTLATIPANSKVYLSSMLAPATLAGAAIAPMPATPFTDAGGLVTAVDTSLTAAKTALTVTGTFAKAAAAIQGETLTAAGTIFDTYCMELAGLMETSTSNHGSANSNTGNLGHIAGVDYTLAVIGVADAVSAGHNVGTPPAFWSFV